MLALLGPTARGKSALAVKAAEKLPIEIVSMDSALVYRGMDIGTAKPAAALCAQVPHTSLTSSIPTTPIRRDAGETTPS